MNIDDLVLRITNPGFFENNNVKFSENVKVRVPAREGNHYQIVSLIDDEEHPVTHHLVIMQTGDDLVIIAQDGAVISIENYFQLADQQQVSFELFSPLGPKDDLLDHDNLIELNDSENFFYAQGDKKQLLEMVEAQADLSEVIIAENHYVPLNNSFLDAYKSTDYLPMGGLLAGAAVALGAASALGGGGGGSDVAFRISGNFTGGPAIEDNDLYVYVFNDEGQQLSQQVKVGDDGAYSISITQSYTGPILIQVRSTEPSGDDYIDESTNEEVSLSTSFRAIAYANGGDLVMNTNAVTEIATRHMLDDSGTAGAWINISNNANAEQAEEQAKEQAQELAAHTQQSIEESYQNLAHALGLDDVDLLTLEPIATNDERFADGSYAAQNYGRILAALSALEEIYGQSTTNVINGILEGLNHDEFDTEEFSQLLEGAAFIDDTDFNADGNVDFLEDVYDVAILDIKIRDEDDEVIEDSIITVPVSRITATLNTGLTGSLQLYGRVDDGEWIELSSYVTGPDLDWTDVTLVEGEHRIQLAITNDGLPPADDGSNLLADISKETYEQDSILPTVESATITIKPEEDEDDDDEDEDAEEEEGEPVELINDESAGTVIVLKIVFSEDMDITQNPSFDTEHSAFVSPREGAWSEDGRTYTIEYMLADGDENVSEIIFQVSSARDVLGNEIEESTEFVVNGIIDTLNPIVPTVTYQATSQSTPTISGYVGEEALEEGASLSVRVDDQVFEDVEVADDGSWSVGLLEPLDPGTYDVIATVTDAHGNTSTSDSNEITDLFIGNGPIIEITSSDVGDDGILNINEGVVIFTFTFSEDVDGFNADDIVITNGEKGEFRQVSSSVYTLEVTPNEDTSGDILVDINENAASSSATGLVNVPRPTYRQAYDFAGPSVTEIELIGTDAEGEEVEVDDVLLEGDIIRVELTMSELTIVDTSNGVPTFTIRLNSGDRVALYDEAESDGETLVFLYTIVEEDYETGNIFTRSSSLNLNNATMHDEAGNQANLADVPTTSKTILVDTLAPQVEDVLLRGLTANNLPKNTALEAGDIIRIEVEMNEVTIVDTTEGTPSYVIIIGAEERHASYVSGSGSSTLVFTYTVLAEDVDNNGITSSAEALRLNGGIIRDELEQEAQTFETPLIFANEYNILVGSAGPSYVGVDVHNGSHIITLNFNKLLNPDSLPEATVFTIEVNGESRTITDVEIQGREVILSYEGDLIEAVDSFAIRYTSPESGNRLEGDDALPVENINIIRGDENNDDLIGMDGEIDIFVFDDEENDNDDIINFSFADGDQVDLSDYLNFDEGDDITDFIEVDDRGSGQDVRLTLTPNGNGSTSGRIFIDLEDIGTGALVLEDFIEHIIV